jgi:hypothetical protein
MEKFQMKIIDKCLISLIPVGDIDEKASKTINEARPIKTDRQF